MFATCFSTAPTVSISALAMPAFERPSAISPSTSSSRGVSAASGPSLPREELRHDLRIERRPAPCDARDRVDELADVHHAVLEQIADAALPVGKQLGGVGQLDVLRDDEDRRFPGPRLRSS